MIDRRLLQSEFEATAARLALKKVSRAELEAVAALLEERRQLTGVDSEARGALNAASKAIGELMKQGRREEADAAKTEVARIKDGMAHAAARLQQVEAELDQALLHIPNLPEDDAPRGHADADNVVVGAWGPSPEELTGPWRPHWEIAEELGLLDSARAAKVSGAMFALLRGDGARLLRALVSFALDLNRERYTEIVPPTFVRTDSFTATGHLPKFADDAYAMERDGLWAIPTGEVPLMAMHRDETLEEAELPLRYMAYTNCFRREAGSYGKDTRGMQRLHEFHKVELVKLCRDAAQAHAEWQALVEDCRRPLELLGLPHRAVDLCTGDMSFSATRTWDLEVWAPGAGKWLEVSSVGKFSDFQARRANIRWRPADGGKSQLVHALNGSGLATPRVWAAIVELGWDQSQRKVRVPPALVPYLEKEFLG